MTALYFETDHEQQLDTAHFDGYPVGDRLLEDVLFIVKIVEGKLEVTIHPDDKGYFSTLNTKLWLKKVTDYVQDYDVFIHPQTGEDVYLVTDEPTEPVVGVVGKAYTWEEVLQKAKPMTEQEKLLNYIQNTIDDWTNEAIYDFDLHGVIESETVKKLILFGANTIAYKILNDPQDT